MAGRSWPSFGRESRPKGSKRGCISGSTRSDGISGRTVRGPDAGGSGRQHFPPPRIGANAVRSASRGLLASLQQVRRPDCGASQPSRQARAFRSQPVGTLDRCRRNQRFCPLAEPSDVCFRARPSPTLCPVPGSCARASLGARGSPTAEHLYPSLSFSRYQAPTSGMNQGGPKWPGIAGQGMSCQGFAAGLPPITSAMAAPISTDICVPWPL